MLGTCRFCGNDSEGTSFFDWVKPTFTDWGLLLPGKIICQDCLFWFDETSETLQAHFGKDKPQRMRNYSHFILNGEWIPLSKANKAQMQALLTSAPFPELAAIADSGQKHIVVRAQRNPTGGKAGWVQFEEARVWVDPETLRRMIDAVERLYQTFSKDDIASGQYASHLIIKHSLERWYTQEQTVKPWRGKPLFALAIFLAQRSDDGSGTIEEPGGGITDAGLAGDGERLQEQVPPDDLATIRGRDQERGLHEQPGEVHQLPLF